MNLEQNREEHIIGKFAAENIVNQVKRENRVAVAACSVPQRVNDRLRKLVVPREHWAGAAAAMNMNTKSALRQGQSETWRGRQRCNITVSDAYR